MNDHISTITDLIEYHHQTPMPERRCLDHGYVRLVDCMPRVIRYTREEIEHLRAERNAGTPIEQLVARKISADPGVLKAARISYISNQKKPHSAGEDRGTIRYLMRNTHTTPFEMVVFQFEIKLPIFVARQFVRHRMSSLNEISGRYSILPNEFYLPSIDEIRAQSKTNKQGSDGVVDPEVAQRFLDWVKHQTSSYPVYEQFAEHDGVAKEMARIGLPLNLYTQWVWKCDLHNLLHMLKLRCDSHAQTEIRAYGEAILDLIRPMIPWTIEAWEDFNPYRNAMLVSALEVESLKAAIANRDRIINAYEGHMNTHSLHLPRVTQVSELLNDRATKRENDEWKAKAQELGLSPMQIAARV